MSKWSSRVLGDAQTSFLDCRDIAETGEEFFAAAGRPPAMAVFVSNVSEGRLHCEVTVYFSPAAQALAKRFQAKSCARPAPDGLDLLAGDPASWDVLFTGEV
ncbi:MAG: hypothetical protein ACRERR_00215 [Moraxellaceae bacterium]